MRFFLFFSAFIFFLGFGASAYQISFKSNVTYGKAYLVYYSGSNLVLQDSAVITPSGAAIFKTDKKLPGGIYSIVYGNNRYSSDFLIDTTQSPSIIADTTALSKTTIEGSAENVLFQSYQNYVAKQGKLLNDARKAFDQAKTKKDSTEKEAVYNNLSKELDAFRAKIIQENSSSMMAMLLRAMKDPALPPMAPKTIEDSIANYQFYKKHYWDNISFSDDRIVRTPFFLPKLENYYREVMPQSQPDTIIKDIDYKLLLARTSPEMYKYLLNWFTDEYFNPKYMGQDAIFVHLFQKYHNQGVSKWLSDKQQETIRDRAYMQMANQIGVQAANLQMLTSKKDTVNLYDIEANYTLLLFWDPTCGHCKTELPRIDSMYRASWKAKGVKIFAVLNEAITPLWEDYIKEHNISDWIHVYQPREMAEAEKVAAVPGYRQLFDVTMTPTLLLLDKDKRIIAKKLTFLQMDDLLTVKENIQ